MIQTIIAGICLIIYAIYCCVKLKEIPASISQTVRALKHSWAWTAVTWALAGTAGPAMLDQTKDGLQIIPIMYMFAMLVVGAAPWVYKGDNKVHNIAGILTCVFSQLWVAITNPTVLLAWILYLPVLKFDKKRWCWWSEWVSMGTTIASIIMN